MLKHLNFGKGVVLILLASLAMSRGENGPAEPHRERVLVKLKNQQGPKQFQTRPVLPGESIEEAITRLEAQSDLYEYAEPDYAISGTASANDPNFKAQWGLSNAKIDSAWDKMPSAVATKVCVVDTGVQYDHPDLVASMDPTYGKGFNAITGLFDAMDDNGHGTHNAGIIAAASNNSQGIAGIAPQATIIPCKALKADMQGYVSDVIKCIDFCSTTAGARIASHSWGTTAYVQSLYDKIKAVSANHLIIAAAGNAAYNNDQKGSIIYPASFDLANIISVAALAADDTLATYSNYGAATVDLAAPGNDIPSTHLGSSYNTASGTSHSTPHVAGAAALLASAKPTASIATLKSALINSARKLTSLTGKCVSGGTLNVDAALTAVLSNTISSPSPTPITKTKGK